MESLELSVSSTLFGTCKKQRQKSMLGRLLRQHFKAMPGRKVPNDTTSDGTEERVDEAFAKIKIAMQNTDPASEPKALTIAEGQGKKTASQPFMDFMHLSPREKVRTAMLAELGIAQEQYDAMSPEDQAKIDKKVEEMVKQEAQQQVAETSSSQTTSQAKEATNNQDDQHTASTDNRDKEAQQGSLVDLLES
ncbi:hypothetical protein ACI2KS_22955 [Pseudomonas sp. NPDC087358]|uniref:hypothetical protein n=1 Tax=Pseudomonas sp. NPDC087358 TaxID=3364439 RepID=UPI00384E3ACF